MAFQEYAHDFGAVTANNAAQFSLPDGYAPTTFRGNANVKSTSSIKYAIIRNNSGGTVTINANQFSSIIGVGMHKRVEFPAGARFFTMTPAATTVAGQVTADVGIDGVTL